MPTFLRLNFNTPLTTDLIKSGTLGLSVFFNGVDFIDDFYEVGTSQLNYNLFFPSITDANLLKTHGQKFINMNRVDLFYKSNFLNYFFFKLNILK